MGLGELGQFFAWFDRERPSLDAQRAVRVLLAEAGAESWLAPSTSIAELSSQPDDEVRSAHLWLADGSPVQVRRRRRRCGHWRDTPPHLRSAGHGRDRGDEAPAARTG